MTNDADEPEFSTLAAAEAEIRRLRLALESLEHLLVIETTAASARTAFGDPFSLRGLVRLALKGEWPG